MSALTEGGLEELRSFRTSGRWSARLSRTGTWRPGLRISHPHPGEEVSRLGHGLAVRSFYRIRRTCIWLGDEANVKPLPLVDQKPEGPGDGSDVPLKRGTGTGMELRALGAMLARVTATTPPPRGRERTTNRGA